VVSTGRRAGCRAVSLIWRAIEPLFERFDRGAYRRIAIKPDAIGRAILYGIEQPNEVDVNEIVVRPLGTQV
jgi:NADP-dependent 3-hydroxy acid dehydrogenase YdfG